MVLTKTELISSLQNEVRILLHLAGKVEPGMVDYRPTEKQRSTLELLKYLTIMGPHLLRAAKSATFDAEAWTTAEKTAAGRTFEQTVAAIGTQSALFADEIGSMSDEDFRTEIEMFGMKNTRGAFIVNMVLSGYAAYRTQLFCYLKACGRHELNTMNLWAGMDQPEG